MQAFWITFEDGTTGCCEGQGAADAKEIAAKVRGDKVRQAQELPYPAAPLIWQFDHPVHGKTPAFCHQPDRCAGCRACPRSISCTS